MRHIVIVVFELIVVVVLVLGLAAVLVWIIKRVQMKLWAIIVNAWAIVLLVRAGGTSFLAVLAVQTSIVLL